MRAAVVETIAGTAKYLIVLDLAGARIISGPNITARASTLFPAAHNEPQVILDQLIECCLVVKA